ncbi:MAG: hypothetical protein MRJ68_15100 [Nitrospira sp.]|nr:hypothetical protein [Nitrospira sp.]
MKSYTLSSMTQSVEHLLRTFDHLADAEKREAVSEILRRVRGFMFHPVSDDELVLTAEELFLALDEREAADEYSQ